MPAKTTQKLLSKKEVCVTRTIAITADNFSFISFPDLSGWRCRNGKCYLYVRDTVTWDWAQQRCRSRNATLVTISSSSENSFVASLIKTNIWIGLNDRVEAGTWDYLGFINQLVTFLRYLLAHIRTQTVIFQWNEELYKMQYEQYRKEMRQNTCLVHWSASYIFDGMLFETHVSGYFWIRKFPFRVRLPSTCIRWIRQTNPQLFESALKGGNFWIRYESGIVWTLNPDIFFIRLRDKIEPISLPWMLYSRWRPRSLVVLLTRWRRIRRGPWERGCSRWLPPYDACSVVNIPRGVLGTRVNPDMCGRVNSIWIRIRVDVEIFIIRKEKVSDSKLSGYESTGPKS